LTNRPSGVPISLATCAADPVKVTERLLVGTEVTVSPLDRSTRFTASTVAAVGA